MAGAGVACLQPWGETFLVPEPQSPTGKGTHGDAGSAPFEAELSMAQVTLVPFATDDAFYAALKLHVYGTVYDTVLKALSSGNTMPLQMAQRNGEGLSVRIGRFTARKANHLFVPEGTNASSSAEFFGFTSHKVREKLSELAEAGTVDKVGRGLRDAKTYQWNEEIKKYQLCSYLRFRTAVGGDTSLALEVYRLLNTFGEDRFTARDFVEAYRTVHEEEYSQSRWGKRKFDEISDSFQYQTFLKNRLKALTEAELVKMDATSKTFELTPKAADAAHHFGLFLEKVPYKASWDMCRTCPARRMCWDLQVTDLVLDAIRGKPAMNGEASSNVHGPVTHGSENGTG